MSKARLIFLLSVAVVVCYMGCSNHDRSSDKPKYSSGYKAFKTLQDEYQKESGYSEKAQNLHDSINPSVADIDYSKPLTGLDSFYTCFGMDTESLTDEYFASLYQKDVSELTPQEVREVNLYVRNANTDIRMKEPFFIKLSEYYGFDDPKEFYRFGEYLMDYIPYSDESSDRVDFTLDEIYEMYQKGDMVFPRTDTPIEKMVLKEMKSMPEVLSQKSSGFSKSEAVEIQNWMRKENSLVRSFIPQVRIAMDENGLEISFDSLATRIMAQYVAEKLGG